MSQKTKKFDMSFIVPAYNEMNNLSETIQKINQFANKYILTKSFEIIIIDDGSTDNTRFLLYELLNKYKKLRIVYYKKNRGKGYAVKRGLIKSKYPIKIILDADLSVQPSEFEKYVSTFQWVFSLPYPSLFNGRRVFVKRQPFYRIFVGKVFQFLSNAITRIEIKDSQCPCKILVNFPESFWHNLNIEGFAYDVELIHDARQKNIPVVSIPVAYHNYPDSSVTFRKASRMFFDLFKIAFKTSCHLASNPLKKR